ncbi:MetQ/NlpA family ABC transporter substrate-binding protein [Ignatzschineria rhizosphaerae]|uniref:MetQ/NlpA family ABC transporter substrate-binding protein n=1 Tax=Ignatzschineria rhizosphaerae TaxID=2923279 RepID=A0ABY3X1G3_9GAMM|nr:MetQ/NlpA family ABC transporter substrate-binding protein [Ignatzschineria rhizosphaerae]UNM95725.1 MetQ/NlpA family ABC transporter substrate-binding protein [Ignatzschineria rhizosphaerae]
MTKIEPSLPKRLIQRIKQPLKVIFTLSALLLITACSEESQATKNHETTLLRISTAPGDFHDLVKEYLAPELAKEGYQVELLVITDTVVPNVAVEEGSLEMNLFQHRPYMEEFNRNQKGKLVPLVQVPTAPYGIYPAKKQTIAALTEGDSVGIPSNVTNFSRGLWILEGLGWITIKEDAPDRFHLTKRDIATNPYNLDIKEIEAAQMLRALPDIDYAIINGKYALDAGIHFTDALYVEPSRHFVNWIVIHERNKESPWAKRVIEIVNSEGFKTYSAQTFKGYDLPLAWD